MALFVTRYCRYNSSHSFSPCTNLGVGDVVDIIEFADEGSLGIGPKAARAGSVTPNAGALRHLPAFRWQAAAAQTQLVVVLLQTFGANVTVLNVPTFHFKLRILMLQMMTR